MLKAAGMKRVAVPEQPHDPAAFSEAGADMIVPSLAQVSWQNLRAALPRKR